jgi:glycosyltransferase involved in cell wall biosynthesis
MENLPEVSVIIPTYHRPSMLRSAVASVLTQKFRDGYFEVIIAVSDRNSKEDAEVALELAASDPRVRVTIAERLGPGVARNAALALARGNVIAFMDDDCEASPEWLNAGVERAAEVDLVQGRTEPPAPRSTRMMKTISVTGLTWMWESCNLFVRRTTVEHAGGFDENWNPTGKPGRHWGEDTEWGWRLVRAGATYAFEPRAEVRHAVWMRTYREVLVQKLALRYFPLTIRRVPEVRRHLYGRYFLNRKHAFITLALGIIALSSFAAAKGSLGLAVAGFVAAAATVLWPPKGRLSETLSSTGNELMNYGVLVYGSLRHRRLVL